MDEWNEYLSYLDEGPYSVTVASSVFAPQVPPLQRESVIVSELGYTLWPFQKILSEIGDSTLVLGLERRSLTQKRRARPTAGPMRSLT